MKDKKSVKKRLRVNAVNNYLSLYDICDGKVDNCIDHLVKFKKDLSEFNPNMSDFEFSLSSNYDGYPSIEVYGYRLETDEEVEKRLEKERLEKEINLRKKEEDKKKELETYLKLKEKYEPK